MASQNPPQDKLTCIRFSSDKTRFICLTKDAIRIYDVSNLSPTPIRKRTEEGQDGKEVINCNLVYGSSDLFAILTVELVAPIEPNLPRMRYTSVVESLTSQEQFIVSPFTTIEKVISMLCTHNKVLTVSESLVTVFRYPEPSGIFPHQKETRDNPKGLCDLSVGQPHIFVTFGSESSSKGSVEIYAVIPTWNDLEVLENRGRIQAHEGELACIALNHSGSLLATASDIVQVNPESDTDTFIRVWDTVLKNKLYEFRRYINQLPRCLTFNLKSSFLCCVSNEQTGLVFTLEKSDGSNPSVTRLFGLMFCIFGVNRCQRPIRNRGRRTRNMDSEGMPFSVVSESDRVCSFLTNDTFIIVCTDGSYRKYKINVETETVSCSESNLNFVPDEEPIVEF